MNKVEVYVDFDHTVFDTDLFFWGDLRSFLNQRGISDHLLEETYFQVQANCYTLRKHLEAMLRKQDRIDDIMADFDQEFSDLSKYLFPDALAFLDQVRCDKNIVLKLLSFGSPNWQRLKVERSGIEKYFKRMIFTDRENSKYKSILSHHYRKNRVVIVDNSPVELDKIKKWIPKANTLLLFPRHPTILFLQKEVVNGYLFRESRKYVFTKPQMEHRKIYSLAEVLQYLS